MCCNLQRRAGHQHLDDLSGEATAAAPPLQRRRPDALRHRVRGAPPLEDRDELPLSVGPAQGARGRNPAEPNLKFGQHSVLFEDSLFI